MSRRVSPLTRFLSVTIAKSACFMEEPINYKIHRNGEKGNGRGRIERRWPAEADQRLAFSHHGTPIGKGRLNADAEEGEGGNGEKHETETQAEFGYQGRQNVG